MSGKLGYLEGNLVVRFPKVVQLVKGRYLNQIGLGEQMTILNVSSKEISNGNNNGNNGNGKLNLSG